MSLVMGLSVGSKTPNYGAIGKVFVLVGNAILVHVRGDGEQTYCGVGLFVTANGPVARR